MSTTLDDVALWQRLDALDTATSIRMKRAGMRRRIVAEGRDGAATAANLLRLNPEVIRSMDVGDFLLWVKHLGKPKIRMLLELRHVSPWCPIDELSEHIRRNLVNDLIRYSEGSNPLPKKARRGWREP